MNNIISNKKLSNFLSKFIMFGGVLFFIIYMFTNDQMNVTELNFRIPYLIISFLLLTLPLLIGVYVWFYSLKQYKIDVPIRIAAASHGLSIFSKYIPGRIWTIISRSAYVANYGYHLVLIAFISARLQIIHILVGLLVGMIPLFLLEIDVIIRISLFAGIVIILIVLANRKIQTALFRLINKITNKSKNKDEHIIEHQDSWAIILIVLIQWTLYSISYFFFVKSIIDIKDVSLGFAFPLSINIGLLSLITPGGIGVRESVIVGYFLLFDIPPSISATISILSRFWFLVGEIFIFLVGLTAKIISAKKE